MSAQAKELARAMELERLRPMPPSLRTLDAKAQEAFLNSVLGIGGPKRTKQYQAMRRIVVRLCAEANDCDFTRLMIGLLNDAATSRGWL